MVGEIRDKETAEIAIHASLTGHLVLSTIHTNDAAGAVTRLVEMGIEPFLVRSQRHRHSRPAAGAHAVRECRERVRAHATTSCASSASTPSACAWQRRAAALAALQLPRARSTCPSADIDRADARFYRAEGLRRVRADGLHRPARHLRAADDRRRRGRAHPQERRRADASSAPRSSRAWIRCATTARARC